MLEELGFTLPAKPTLVQALLRMRSLKRRLKDKSDECLLRLPKMDSSSDKLAIMQILNILFSYSFVANQELGPFIAEKMIRITLDHGLSVVSSVGFTLYGTILCW
jgi:predicted ATPase